MPVVGFSAERSLTYTPDRVTAFRQGLKEAGFVEGQNVAIEIHSSGAPTGAVEAGDEAFLDRVTAGHKAQAASP